MAVVTREIQRYFGSATVGVKLTAAGKIEKLDGGTKLNVFNKCFQYIHIYTNIQLRSKGTMNECITMKRRRKQETVVGTTEEEVQQPGT